MSTELHVLRVFLAPDGSGGNPLGSRLSTRLGPDGSVDLGGRVVLDEVRPFG